MKTKILLSWLAAALWLIGGIPAFAQGTAFSYQGRLNLSGNPTTGIYDLRFAAYASLTAPTPLNTQTISAVPVSNGLFTVILDFGSGMFTGPQRWLEIGVRTNGAASFATLDPRQLVTASPYAIHAGTASNVLSGSVVRSLNGLKDDLTLAAGANVSIAPSGNTLMISSTGPGGNIWSLSGANTYYNAGNVGIGLSDPTHRLTVSAPDQETMRLLRSTTGYGEGARLNFGDGDYVFIEEDLDDRLQIQANRIALMGGNIGIGTTTPLAQLDVRGNLLLDNGGSPALYTAAGGGEQNRYLNLLNSPTYQSASGLKAGGVLVSDDYYFADPGKNHLVVKGNVGLGTPVYDFSSKLTIAAQDALSIEGYQPFITMADANEFGLITPPRRYFQVVSDDLHFLYRRACNSFPCPPVVGHMVIKGNGNVGIGTTTPQAKLDVAGSLRTTVLTITGGADIAEPFKMSSDQIPKGSVVVIDEQNPGHLKMSMRAYDTRVAGVVSGANGINPGISLHQEGAIEGGENVALSGRVYVQTDATANPIKPGDLLTTSETPGHAMKVNDRAKAQGAILGKAMTGLDQGKGMVLVLVTLQ